MTIAAVDETDYNLWLDALSDTLEIREMAIQVQYRTHHHHIMFHYIMLSRFHLLMCFEAPLTYCSASHWTRVKHQTLIFLVTHSTHYFLLFSLLFSSFQRDAFNGGSKADQAERGLTKEQRKAERIAAIRSSVIYSGHLLTKNVKESIFKSAWKDRYFVIASGV